MSFLGRRTATTTDGGVSFFRLPQPFEAAGLRQRWDWRRRPPSWFEAVGGFPKGSQPSENAAAADARHAALTWSDSWQDVATILDLARVHPTVQPPEAVDPSQAGSDAARSGESADSDISRCR